MLMCCISDVSEPNITVYRQIEDREHVIVLCKFAEMFRMTYRWQSFELSVESELDYTIEPVEFFPFYYSEMQVFLVTVRPPASFTCVHEIYSDLDVRNLRSQTYNYNHPEEGASLLYICFSSFIAVGLFIMTAAVIVINIRSKTKGVCFTSYSLIYTSDECYERSDQNLKLKINGQKMLRNVFKLIIGSIILNSGC
uniref:Uncharacterized protein n=1 Tax=Cyprinus carpio TaxID=7962 RepID=A0A8C1UBL0_CYPCA